MLLFVNHGIRARRRRPTDSMGCAAARARMAVIWFSPDAFSSIQSRANFPD